jgi:steroid 5-alpha reductase family enzyme
VAFCLAALVVWAVSPSHLVVRLGVGTAVATVVIFAASVLADNSSMYDPYWSLQPLAIAACYLGWLHPAVSGRGWLVTALILVYAVRLTANFYRGWGGLSQEDFRYRGFRERFGRAYWPVSFFGIHLFPTVLVWLGCLPLYVVMKSSTSAMGWLDAVAVIVCLGAVGLELVADEQLRRFRRDPANQGRPIDCGLWSLSRHPNYLGEIMWWWGLWLFALAVDPGAWWSGVGAVAITLMFVFASVPMMEARALATRPGYERYRESTPMLLPLRLRRVPEGDAGEG